jgi:FkbM family methyltransferase
LPDVTERRRVARTFVKKVFAAAGLDVSRRNAHRMHLSMAEALRHLARSGFQPATVVDVGVGNGTSDLYAAFPDATFLLIEPLEEFRPVLEDVASRYRASFVVAAAGRERGSVDMFVHSYLEGSSLLRERGEQTGIVAREVPMVTIDDLCDEHDLTGPSLIKIDVQGGEIEALSGATRSLADAEVVILEVSLFQFVEDGPELHDVISFMKDKGFVAYDLFGGHVRPLDGALAQVDIVFVKEHGRFRRSHAYGHA